MNAFDAIHNRQGVLRFKSDPIEREIIERVLHAAIAAPSPANTQPWEFIVIDNGAQAKDVARYLVDTQVKHVFEGLMQTSPEFTGHLRKLYDDFYQAPCFVVLCRYQRTVLAQSEYADALRDWDLCSIGAAMANLMTAATALGLGTRWFGNPMLEPEPLQQMLNLPNKIEIIAVTPLGYHDESPKQRPAQTLETHIQFERGDKYKLAALLDGKLSLEDVVHFNTFSQK